MGTPRSQTSRSFGRDCLRMASAPLPPSSRLPSSGRATPSRQLQAVKQPLPLPLPAQRSYAACQQGLLEPQGASGEPGGAGGRRTGQPRCLALGVYGVTNGLICWWCPWSRGGWCGHTEPWSWGRHQLRTCSQGSPGRLAGTRPRRLLRLPAELHPSGSMAWPPQNLFSHP